MGEVLQSEQKPADAYFAAEDRAALMAEYGMGRETHVGHACRKEDIDMNIKRGDIYYADLTPVVGSEQGGTRPVLIIQNDTGNRHSPTVIVAAITSRQGKKPLPTHIRMENSLCGLGQESTVLLEQVRTIDCTRLKEYIGRAGKAIMQDVDYAIAVSFGLEGRFIPKKEPDLRTGKNADREPMVRYQTETGKEKEGTTYGKQETGMGLQFY